jgi:hypothetical protein
MRRGAATRSLRMEWTQPHDLKRPLEGQDGKVDHPQQRQWGGSTMEVTTIGIDVAKNVFGVHGVDAGGRVTVRTRLARDRLLEFLGKVQPCLAGC